MRSTLPGSKMKYLSRDEFNSLIDSILIYDRSSKFQFRNIAMFLVAEYCALRASEVGMIELSDFDYHKGTIFCKRLKGSVSNHLKIVDQRVLKYLRLHYEERVKKEIDSPYLFVSKLDNPISRKTLDSLMKFYCSFAHIHKDKAHFHALKHTRAMELIATKGIDVRDVQWWLGHKYITNTMIYLNYSIEAQEELYSTLENSMYPNT